MTTTDDTTAAGRVRVDKYHGTGNDFVVVDADAGVPDRRAFARAACDRETGLTVPESDRVGADGVLFLAVDADAAPPRAEMTLVQPDGSVAAMCGNGARCAARWVRRRVAGDRDDGPAFDPGFDPETDPGAVVLDTPAGSRRATVHKGGDVTVEMGRPSVARADVPLSPDRGGPLVEEPVGGLTVTAVNTGVPHAVAFVADVDAVDLAAVAPAIRHADVFPEGANVTLASPHADEGPPYRQRTFERGVEGETLSCGTGAVAVAAVARRLGAVAADEAVGVSPPGGDLVVTAGDPATLRGPVAVEFATTVDAAAPAPRPAVGDGRPDGGTPASADADFDPLAFHERAVRTESHETPDRMRELLCETLRAGGVDPRVDGAGNVVAVRGSGRPHYVLNTHIDTVPPHVAFERRATPPGAEGEGTNGEDGATAGNRDGGDSHGADDSEPPAGVVAGRGACDAKGPLAAIVAAFLAVAPADGEDGGRVTLAITPDEETDSAGAAHLLSEGALAPDGDAPAIDGVVVGEPTELDACTAARGRFEGAVALEGAAAHAAEPESGASAVRALGPVLDALDAYDDDHGPGVHEALGGPTLTATAVEGGEATNQVPASCRLSVDRRSVPPESAEEFERTLDAHLRERLAASTVDGVDVSFGLIDRPTPFLEAFATDGGSRVVEAMRAAGAGEPRPFAAATEAAYFAARSPTVVFGPGALADETGPVAHAEREYVRRGDVVEAAAVLRGALSTLVE